MGKKVGAPLLMTGELGLKFLRAVHVYPITPFVQLKVPQGINYADSLPAKSREFHATHLEG